MAEKRKDRRGRILRTGESQRHDLTYQFRYKNHPNGKWQYVYAPTLEELRRKEIEIQEDFGQRKIKDIKVSDAQLWFIKLHNDGKGYSTLTSVRGVVKPAFQMAYNEDIVRKNPFDFRIVDVVPNDSERRIAMTEEQQNLWMTFIRTDKTYSKYYDEFVVLLETGMRVSEFSGLRKLTLTLRGAGFV